MDKDELESCYLPAAWEVLNRFPVAAEKIVPISVSENLTFRVLSRDSDADFSLRLHRPGYNSLAELDSERMWTRALQAAGIVVPDALKTREGDNYALIDIPGTGEQRYAGVTRWIEGTTLRDDIDATLDPAERLQAFRWIGAIQARMHNHAVRWQAPPGFTRRRLDLDGLLGETPAWGRFWEHAELTAAEQALLLEKRRELNAVLSAYGERPDHFSLIHADVDPGNIIHDGGELALIDFDDLAYGWHLYDMASSLDEFMYAEDFEALESALLDGYREHRPLARADAGMLPHFLLLRGMALIGWYHQRPEHSGSSYFQEVKAWVLAQCAG